jgi:integrase
MPSHEEHCQDSLKRYGKRFDELHRWLDEPSTMLANGHRIYRHDPVSTPKLARKLFGEFADQAALDHIRLDKLESSRLKKENTKRPRKPKKGYWKDHKFYKPSMLEVVTEYCGDKFLEELIEKCNEIPYRVNQDYFRKRDKALVSDSFLTGGRISEVLTLKKDNFDFENEEAKRNNAFLVKDMGILKHYSVKGKPRRVTRTFPIWFDDPLVQILCDWLTDVENYLFPELPLKSSPISRQRAYQIISFLGKHVDVPTHINPSWFRIQRQYYLVKRKRFSPYDVQAYFKLKHPPTIFRHREDWQNLLAVAGAGTKKHNH